MAGRCISSWRISWNRLIAHLLFDYPFEGMILGVGILE